MNRLGRFCLGLMLTIVLGASALADTPIWAFITFVILVGLFVGYGGNND